MRGRRESFLMNKNRIFVIKHFQFEWRNEGLEHAMTWKLFISYQIPSGIEFFLNNTWCFGFIFCCRSTVAEEYKNIFCRFNKCYVCLCCLYQSIMYLIILNRMFYHKGYCYLAVGEKCIHMYNSFFLKLLTEVVATHSHVAHTKFILQSWLRKWFIDVRKKENPWEKMAFDSSIKIDGLNFLGGFRFLSNDFLWVQV